MTHDTSKYQEISRGPSGRFRTPNFKIRSRALPVIIRARVLQPGHQRASLLRAYVCVTNAVGLIIYLV